MKTLQEKKIIEQYSSLSKKKKKKNEMLAKLIQQYIKH